MMQEHGAHQAMMVEPGVPQLQMTTLAAFKTVVAEVAVVAVEHASNVVKKVICPENVLKVVAVEDQEYASSVVMQVICHENVLLPMKNT